MTKKHLLDKILIPEHNVNRIIGENDPKKEAVRYGNLIENKLKIRNNSPYFHLMILGIG